MKKVAFRAVIPFLAVLILLAVVVKLLAPFILNIILLNKLGFLEVRLKIFAVSVVAGILSSIASILFSLTFLLSLWRTLRKRRNSLKRIEGESFEEFERGREKSLILWKLVFWGGLIFMFVYGARNWQSLFIAIAGNSGFKPPFLNFDAFKLFHILKFSFGFLWRLTLFETAMLLAVSFVFASYGLVKLFPSAVFMGGANRTVARIVHSIAVVLFITIAISGVVTTSFNPEHLFGYVEFYGRCAGCAVFSLFVFIMVWRFGSHLKKYGEVKLKFILSRVAFLGVFYAITFIAYPYVLNKFVVQPTELERQRKFIGYRLNFTRFAYALSNIEKKVVKPELLSAEAVESNMSAFLSVRIWDARPLKEVVKAFEEVRTFYEFPDVDLDVYPVNGTNRLVAVSVRELETPTLPEKLQNWINLHLRYTHGYGVVVADVGAVSNGRPVFLLNGIPPKTEFDSLNLELPEIYYGELTSDYCIAGTKAGEYDYPLGPTNEVMEYDGTGGIEMSFWVKLLTALKWNDWKVVLSSYITRDARLMFHREVKERLEFAVPYFVWDSDPYPVICGGRVCWIVWGYSTMPDFAVSEKFGQFSYVFPSVVAVVSAYDGTVELYSSFSDPISQIYRFVIPQMKPVSQMPAELKKHIHYPYDLALIQTKVLETYHIDLPDVFYHGEDVWVRAVERGNGTNVVKIEPYYLLDDDGRIVLGVLFSPKGKDNLRAWVKFWVDDELNPRVKIFEVSGGQLVEGPLQFEAMIDQDAELSAKLTLWNQSGSKVVRGDTFFMSVSNSLVYFKPIYLKAEVGGIPELKLVIMANSKDIGSGESVLEAIVNLFEKRGKRIRIEEAEGKLKRVSELYRKATESMQKWDWKGFGEAMQKIGEILEVVTNEQEK